MELLARSLLEYPQRCDVLTRAGESAAAVDADRASPYELLEHLGGLGLLELGRNGTWLSMAAVVHDLASECVATAFSLWGHRMAMVYHDAVGAALPAGVISGRVPAVSAMAPVFKAAAGIGEIPVRARRVNGGLALNGRMPWASNIYEDAVVVLPVVSDGADGGAPLIVRTTTATTGFRAHHLENLLALNATRSASLEFTDLVVPDEDILTEEVPEFLAAVTGPFLLLQGAFCLGLSAAALNSAVGHLTGVNEVFTPDAHEALDEYERLRRDLLAMAEDPAAHRGPSLLKLRLDSGRLTGTATRLEAAVVGGRGYQATSATARRLREAAFLPVQSPTEGHLRWQLQHSG